MCAMWHCQVGLHSLIKGLTGTKVAEGQVRVAMVLENNCNG
jgi:hypothetical protein